MRTIIKQLGKVAIFHTMYVGRRMLSVWEKVVLFIQGYHFFLY